MMVYSLHSRFTSNPTAHYQEWPEALAIARPSAFNELLESPSFFEVFLAYSNNHFVTSLRTKRHYDSLITV